MADFEDLLGPEPQSAKGANEEPYADLLGPEKTTAARVDQPPPDEPDPERAFQNWYAGHAQTWGLNPNPDDPRHFYDYRAAYEAGAKPDATGHWPSTFKLEGHPNMVVGGVNTKTGQPVQPAVEVGPALAQMALKQQGLQIPMEGGGLGLQAPANPFATSARVSDLETAKTLGEPITGAMVMPTLLNDEQRAQFSRNVSTVRQVFQDPSVLTRSANFEDWFNNQRQPGEGFAPVEQGGGWHDDDLRAMLHDAGVPTTDNYNELLKPKATLASTVAGMPAAVTEGAVQTAEGGKAFMAHDALAFSIDRIKQIDAMLSGQVPMLFASRDDLTAERAKLVSSMGPLATDFQAAMDATKASQEALARATPQGQNLPLEALTMVATTAVPLAAGVGIGLVNPGAGLTAMGIASVAQTIGPSYNEAIAKGLSPNDAYNYALIQATIAAAGNVAGLKAASGPGQTLLNRLLSSIFLSQPAAMAGQAGWADVVRETHFGDQTVESVLHDVAVSYLAGHAVGVATGLAGHALAGETRPGIEDYAKGLYSGIDPTQQEGYHAWGSWAPGMRVFEGEFTRELEQQQLPALTAEEVARRFATDQPTGVTYGQEVQQSGERGYAGGEHPDAAGLPVEQRGALGEPETAAPGGGGRGDERGLEGGAGSEHPVATVAELPPGTEGGAEDGGRGSQLAGGAREERTAEADRTQPEELTPALGQRALEVTAPEVGVESEPPLGPMTDLEARARDILGRQEPTLGAPIEELPSFGGPTEPTGVPQEGAQEPPGRVEPTGPVTISELMGEERQGPPDQRLATHLKQIETDDDSSRGGGLYSQLYRHIEDKMPESMPTKDLIGWINGQAKQGAFKPRELEWSGLEDWLRATSEGVGEPNRKITKQEVKDFLMNNRIEIAYGEPRQPAQEQLGQGQGDYARRDWPYSDDDAYDEPDSLYDWSEETIEEDEEYLQERGDEQYYDEARQELIDEYLDDNREEILRRHGWSENQAELFGERDIPEPAESDIPSDDMEYIEKQAHEKALELATKDYNQDPAYQISNDYDSDAFITGSDDAGYTAHWNGGRRNREQHFDDLSDAKDWLIDKLREHNDYFPNDDFIDQDAWEEMENERLAQLGPEPQEDAEPGEPPKGNYQWDQYTQDGEKNGYREEVVTLARQPEGLDYDYVDTTHYGRDVGSPQGLILHWRSTDRTHFGLADREGEGKTNEPLLALEELARSGDPVAWDRFRALYSDMSDSAIELIIGPRPVQLERIGVAPSPPTLTEEVRPPTAEEHALQLAAYLEDPSLRVLAIEELQAQGAQNARDNRERYAQEVVRKQRPDLYVQATPADRAEIRKLEGQVMARTDPKDSFMNARQRQHLLDDIKSAAPELPHHADYSQMRAYHVPEHLVQRLEQQDMATIPLGPFVTHSEDVVALGLKRMLVQAAQDGYEALAWTPGAQQAASWAARLQEHVDELHWDPKTASLSAYKDGEFRKLVAEATADALPRIVGKDIADKLMLAEPSSGQPSVKRYNRVGDEDEFGRYDAQGDRIPENQLTAVPPGMHVVRGKDLTISSAGMVFAYDRLMPKMMAEILKKAGFPKLKISLEPAGYLEGSHKPWWVVRLPPELRQQILGRGLPLFTKESERAAINAGYAGSQPEAAIPQVVNRSIPDAWTRSLQAQGIRNLTEREQAVVSAAWKDLRVAGWSDGQLAGVKMLGAFDPKSSADLAWFNPFSRTLSLSEKLIAEATAPDGMKRLSGAMDHEAGHSIDLTQVDSISDDWRSIAANSPRLEGFRHEDGRLYAAQDADLFLEIMEAGKRNPSGPIARFFEYPYGDRFRTVDAYTQKAEGFAQLTNLFHGNPELMKAELPKAYEALEATYSAGASQPGDRSLSATRAALRQALRASDSLSRDESIFYRGANLRTGKGPVLRSTGAGLAGEHQPAGQSGNRARLPADDTKRAGDAGLPGGPGGRDDTAATPDQPIGPRLAQKQSRPDEIREFIRERFGVPITQGRQGAGNLGLYRVKPRTIRIKDPNDLETLAHELGHHFEESFPQVKTILAAAHQELLGLVPQAYFGKRMTQVALRSEGFAEFLSHELTNPQLAAAQAPAFSIMWRQFLDAHPEQAANLAAVQKMIGSRASLSPEERILQKMGGPRRSILDVAKDALRQAPKEFVFETLDRWDPIRRAVRDFAPGYAAGKDPYKSFRLLAGDAAMIEDTLTRGVIPFRRSQRLDLANYGKPLTEILKPIWTAGLARKFTAYLIARRAAELLAVGKERLLTPNEIAAGLNLETPAMRQVADEVYRFNDQLLQYRVDGGALTPELAEKFREYEAYIPFFRFHEEAGNFWDRLAGGAQTPTGHGLAVKRLTGGRANLNDIVENLVANAAQTIYATNRNAAVRQLAHFVQDVPGAGRIAETVPVPMQALTLGTDQIIEHLEAQGLTVDRSLAQNLAVQQTFFQQRPVTDKTKRIIIYMDEGKYKALQINDAMVWRSLNSMEPPQIGMIFMPLVLAARLARAGIVTDPQFMVGNFSRDTLSATIAARSRFIPFYSTLKGAGQAFDLELAGKQIAQMADNQRYFRALGGGQASIWQSDPKSVADIVAKMARRGGFAKQLILTPARIMEVLEAAGAAVESGTRLSEFTSLLGDPGAASEDAAVQATLAGRDVSTDFGMHGASPALRILVRMTPFMNPAMQGLSRAQEIATGRAGRPAQAKMLITGLSMALLSVLLWLNNRDKDWYKRLENWELNTYWHFDLGTKSPEGKVVPFRLPKPFEYGLFFSSIPEMMAKLAIERNGQEFRDRLAQGLGMVLGFRVIPTVPNTVADWAYNKDSFTGRPIIPDKQAHLEPKLQYSGGTTLSSRALADVTHEVGERIGTSLPDLGQAVKTSPANTDFLVKNFTGNMGMYALLTSDMLLQATGEYPAKPERLWYQYPVIRKLFHDPDNPSAKPLTDFYNEIERTRRAAQSLKAQIDTPGEEAYRARHEAELERAKANEKTAQRLAKKRAELSRIDSDMQLSPHEKRLQRNEVIEEMKQLSEGRLQEIDE